MSLLPLIENAGHLFHASPPLLNIHAVPGRSSLELFPRRAETDENRISNAFGRECICGQHGSGPASFKEGGVCPDKLVTGHRTGRGRSRIVPAGAKKDCQADQKMATHTYQST